MRARTAGLDASSAPGTREADATPHVFRLARSARGHHHTQEAGIVETFASTHGRQVSHLISISISYAWESEEHKAWVARLASALRRVGLKVKLDQSDLRPGSDLTAYMESAIRDSDYVLLICTPDFAGRADRRLGGVGYEQAVVTGEMHSGVAGDGKFIPILRGDPQASVPSFLRNRVWADFREDSDFDRALNRLLSALHHSTVEPVVTSEADDTATDLDEDLQVYQDASDFARSRSGLAMTKALAAEFAESCKEAWSIGEFRMFVRVFTFANCPMKLARSDAHVFALDWMERDEYKNFDVYQDAFEFAVSREGMGCRVSEARSFAEEFDENPGLGYLDRFKQAFSVARGTGKSRSEAEDFAHSEL